MDSTIPHSITGNFKRDNFAGMTMFVRRGVAAKILGVCTKTLRRWETRGIIIPHRTAGKHGAITRLPSNSSR
ncbi:MAG: MerR family DNA-binding transcriptional regulator [Candidatus Hodarchaeales archaeon]